MLDLDKCKRDSNPIDFSQDIDFEYLLNKYGPEGLYELADKLKDIANEDVSDATGEMYNNYQSNEEEEKN